MWFRPRQPDLPDIESIQRGRGREPECDFHRISTRSVPFQYSTEANGYESDVLSFTSLLDSPHSTSDLDFMAQNELLRQEVRKMQQDNLAREEIRLELDGHEDEHGNGQDLGDGDAPSPHLPSTPAGPSSETHASSPSPSSSIPPEPDTSASPGSSGMRRLQVTRASTRGKPTSDDHIDVNLVPANLEVTMNDRGQAPCYNGPRGAIRSFLHSAG